MRSSPIIVIAVASLALTACSSEKATRDTSSPVAAGGTSAGTSGVGTPDGSPPPDTASCPSDLPGPKLVRLATPRGVSYCMDRTEVTQADFAQFVAASEKDGAALHPQGEPAQCKAPYKLLPDAGEYSGDVAPVCPKSRYEPSTKGDAPMVCVHACAAQAYCLWAGKELCGAVTGGPVSEQGATDPETSAWQNACTNGGTTDVAVPGGMETGTCKMATLFEQLPAEETPECVGSKAPFDAVLNIGGGVAEIEAGPDGQFFRRGPHSKSGSAPPVEACGEYGLAGEPRDVTGFRCCKPLPKLLPPDRQARGGRHPRRGDPSGSPTRGASVGGSPEEHAANCRPSRSLSHWRWRPSPSCSASTAGSGDAAVLRPLEVAMLGVLRPTGVAMLPCFVDAW